MKLFQNLTSGFRKEDFVSYPRNLPVKLFQNWTSGSEEKIFKESLKKFHFVTMATTVLDGIKFCEQFLKRTPQGTFLPSLVQIGPAV